MDIKITEKSLRTFLKTDASIDEIIDLLCKSGPTVDRFKKEESDTILEIEIITNRVDSASVFGVAREANAILNQNKITSELINNPYEQSIPTNTATETLNFSVTNPNLVKRFVAVSIDQVTVKQSPEDTIDLLQKSDQRPINSLVDATNEATLLYGIPSHVFDKDKLALQSLTIREAIQGEVVTTLDNDKVKLATGDIVIEDGSGRLVDLCGVMGGQIAEVDEHSKNIILIVPIYNPQKIRKTSLLHQKRSLAAQIYEKGPDPDLCLLVLSILSKTIMDRAGGKISSKILDINNTQNTTKTIELSLTWLNNFAGIEIPPSEIISILNNLSFINPSINENKLSVGIPNFRATDINIKEDLAEEIIRIYGYYKIPATLPPLSKTTAPSNPIFKIEAKLKNILSNNGYNEIYNSSLVSKSLIETCNLVPSDHLRLTNCLSEDLEYLRTSLVPSALQNHANNKGKTSKNINIFEIANVYLPQSDKKLPNEISTLTFSSNTNILDVKSILEKIFIQLNYQNYNFTQPSSSNKTYFDPQNSADIYLNNELIGQIGEIKTSILRSFGLTETISMVEINISKIENLKPVLNFQPISEYPDLKFDITVSSSQPIGEIIKRIKSHHKLIYSVQYISSFEGKHSFTISLRSYTENLTKETGNQIQKDLSSLF